MATRHLSDREIQADLDKTSQRRNRRVQQHLAFCSKCRNQWNAYRILFQELNRDIPFRLPDHRVAAILANQPIPSPAGHPRFAATVWIPALGLALAVGVLLVINRWIPVPWVPWELPKIALSLPRIRPSFGFDLQKLLAFISIRGTAAACLILLIVGIGECLRLRTWIRSLRRVF